MKNARLVEKCVETNQTEETYTKRDNKSNYHLLSIHL